MGGAGPQAAGGVVAPARQQFSAEGILQGLRQVGGGAFRRIGGPQLLEQLGNLGRERCEQGV